MESFTLDGRRFSVNFYQKGFQFSRDVQSSANTSYSSQTSSIMPMGIFERNRFIRQALTIDTICPARDSITSFIESLKEQLSNVMPEKLKVHLSLHGQRFVYDLFRFKISRLLLGIVPFEIDCGNLLSFDMKAFCRHIKVKKCKNFLSVLFAKRSTMQ